MRAILLVPALWTLFATPASAQSFVKASQFGFDPADSTVALQSALDSSAATVIIDYTGAAWITRPLFVHRDNLRIVFEPGVILDAKSGAFPRVTDSLITAVDRSNLIFSGYGATLRMRKREYTSGEWRMALNLQSCSHVRVEGLSLCNSGGDGIYVGDAGPPHQRYCLDVHIRDVRCDNNRRQGISIISAQDLLIEDSLLTNTAGTAPQSGIDFEPDEREQRLVHCLVRNTRMEGNHGNCMLVVAQKLDAASQPVSIRFEGISCSGPSSAAGIEYVGVAPPSSLVEWRDVLVEGFRDTGMSVLRTAAYGSGLLLCTRCVFREIGRLPLDFSAKDPPRTESGGVRWVDTAVYFDGKTVLGVAGGIHASSAANLKGNITVFGAQGAAMSLGPKPHDVQVTFAERRKPVATTVTVQPSGSGFTVRRTSTDLTYPLAVRYVTAGPAKERFDYSGLAGVAIIAPAQESVAIPVTWRADASSGQTLALTLPESPYYTVSRAGSRATIAHGAAGPARSHPRRPPNTRKQ